ncbi:sugar transferase [Endozoicomonas euniceicola]|uniref:Sugar transferase n=1 Tax=Endozoicomonas euniceicola TaxID=1234143 RepID=A0ABY6GUE6_9GAMM|nr:sugar transferase [Endozoicomonas euniceicola]UYM15701.1 sugar transferase [Endozoicomonas euniceicola]
MQQVEDLNKHSSVENCKTKIIELELCTVDSNSSRSIEVESDRNKSDFKPKIVCGKSGHFASVEYKLETDEVTSAKDGKVWICKKYGNCEPLYIYTPSANVALLRHILQEKKINYIINDYSKDESCRNHKAIYYFQLGDLKPSQREFLVKQVKYGVKVISLIEEFERKLGYTEVGLLNSDYYIDDKSFSVLRRKHHTIPKRIVDLVLVMTLMPVAIPVGLLTALFIKIESPGKVLFKQKRAGLYNKEFEVIKFRSMRQDAESSGAKWASKNDNRVTKVGRFIRKMRIDELPQLINVLKGEMSMVGPRPEREVFIKELEKQIPYYRFRHAVKPGVTGYAQVQYPYGASLEDAVWKHKYDMYYIKHQSLWMDFKILAKTVTTVLFGKGV